MTFNEKQREFENARLREIEEEEVCYDCGEDLDCCSCGLNPDEYDEVWNDERADMEADRYFGDY